MSDSAGTDTGLARPEREPGRPSVRKGEERRPSLPGRVILFYKQVIAELRKVIWPTRSELITYTSVVLVFVIFMVGVVAIFDFVFSQGVLKVFGGG